MLVETASVNRDIHVATIKPEQIRSGLRTFFWIECKIHAFSKIRQSKKGLRGFWRLILHFLHAILTVNYYPRFVQICQQ
jgi:hypothetical protein